ncbi:alpha/beta fold hydrolase [Pelagibius sp. Alg239-R121]|uniref:alpha/beta fold hydrolase n=1 Tax=Pelagibius sp. Alg239-R121 TaxID=2993448 RepID=UPI0024A78F13|nr:alpha/beta hydrolase [Pelagibius sp. Alg239-R121]
MAHILNIAQTDRSPIVALHSSASDGRQWAGLVSELCDRHEVLAYNLPGYGQEFKRCTSQQGMAVVAEPIIQEILKFGETVHLVGHSFGGGVALKIALMRPDLVKSLTLYEPVSFHVLNNGSQADAALLSGLKQVEQGLLSDDTDGRTGPAIKPFIDFWNGQGAWDAMPESLRNKLISTTAAVVADFVNCFGETWRLDDLKGLDIPTQILMGMESPAIAQRTATLVFEHIQEAELVMLPGLGHMAPIHAPDWVNPRIKQHIARVERCAEHFAWPQTRAA